MVKFLTIMDKIQVLKILHKNLIFFVLANYNKNLDSKYLHTGVKAKIYFYYRKVKYKIRSFKIL